MIPIMRRNGLWYVKLAGKWSDDGMSLHEAIEYIRNMK